MTVGTEQLVTAELLRDFVDGLKLRANLNAHRLSRLLATQPEFGRYVGTTDGASLVGDHIARGLRAIWRQRFMPPVLSAERLVKWNAFFILEVMYFFPCARGLPFPDTLKDAAVLLCDANHLALIVASGDAAQAARLVAGNPEFWARIIPAALTPAEQTLHSRRNASLGKLARELNGLLTMARNTTSQLEAVRPIGREAAVGAPVDNEIAATRQSGDQMLPEVQVAQQAAPLELPDEPLSSNARRMLEALAPAPRPLIAQATTCNQPNLR